MENKQLAVWLPKDFVDKFEEFLKLVNANKKILAKITRKDIVVWALSEFMENHPDGVMNYKISK